MNRSARIVIVIPFVLLALVRCTPFDYGGHLPNGYELSKNNASEILIYSQLSSQEPINIDSMNIQGDFIFGRGSLFNVRRTKQMHQEQNPGYFILNTKTDSYQLGLTRQQWDAELKKIGVSFPVLHQPTAFADEPILITISKGMMLVGLLKFAFFPKNR